MIIEGILIALLGIALVLLTRSITTFFHELGHALPALLFTESDVTVYVGSYGDISKSLFLDYGRLKFYLTFNVFGWNIGMCTHKPTKDFQKDLFIILGGPLMSLAISLFLLNAIRNYGLDEGTIFILAIFMASTFWDFCVNIYPSASPMQMHDGAVVYSDGAQVLGLIQQRKYPESFFQGHQYFEEEKYDEAILQWNKMMAEGYKNDGILDLILDALLKKQDFQAALEHVDEHYYGRKLNSIDLAKLGDIYVGLNNYRESLQYYNESLFLNYRDGSVLNKRGKAHMQLGEYEEALEDFLRAAIYLPDSAEAFSNLGATKIQLNYLEDGYSDIMQALAIQDDLPIAHLYLGIYFEKSGNYRKALEHFEKAKALGAQHHGLEFYIAESKRML